MESQFIGVLGEWITFIFQAFPAKLRPTFLELLLGCMICRSGHVTDALLSIRFKCTWTTYFKAIEKGNFSWLKLLEKWTKLLFTLFPSKQIILVIDDFLTPRASKKAPSAALHHDHATRPNRPNYIWGQLRIGLSMICSKAGRFAALPLLMHLVRTKGNSTKLDNAKLMINLVFSWMPAGASMTILADAWYMKGPLLLSLIEKGINFIGQVRKDTALFMIPMPPKKPKRGKPRTYGAKLTFDEVAKRFKLQEAMCFAYGKERLFQFYGFNARVRFLKGAICKVVWCRFQRKKGWTKWHLLIGTNAIVLSTEIIRLYALRWWTEPLFNELKNLFGLKNAWQQSRQALARWTAILSLSYGLTKLLALWSGEKVIAALFPIPWRKQRPVTASWAANIVAVFFRGLPVRRLWSRKWQKFDLPKDWIDDFSVVLS